MKINKNSHTIPTQFPHKSHKSPTLTFITMLTTLFSFAWDAFNQLVFVTRFHVFVKPLKQLFCTQRTMLSLMPITRFYVCHIVTLICTYFQLSFSFCIRFNYKLIFTWCKLITGNPQGKSGKDLWRWSGQWRSRLKRCRGRLERCISTNSAFSHLCKSLAKFQNKDLFQVDATRRQKENRSILTKK